MRLRMATTPSMELILPLIDDTGRVPLYYLFKFFVPTLTATGFHTLAWILTGFLAVSGIVSTIGAPRSEGETPPRS